MISKNKVLTLLLCGAMLTGTVFAPISNIYATEVDEAEMLTAVNEEEVGEETTPELEYVPEEEAEYETPVFDWEEYYNTATGCIDGNRFVFPADGMIPLKLYAKLVDDFDEDCYIYLEEADHPSRKIKVTLFPEENFERTIYLPAGYYKVIESGVNVAPTLSFTKTVIGVSLVEKYEDYEIGIILNDAHNVRKNAIGKWENVAVDEDSTDLDQKIFDVEALEGIQSDLSGVLYYSVEHTGPKKTRFVDKEVEVEKDGQIITEIQQVEEVYFEEPGLGFVTPFGNATKSKDIVLEITKEGVIGQAEFKVSYDGGQTFVAKYTTGAKVLDSNVNLTYEFYTINDTDELTAGDRFIFTSIESFEVKNSTSDAASRIACVGHPLDNHELNITILSSGGRGISRIKIVDAKNKLETKTYLIPENGILSLDDNLTLYFENIKGYVKDVTYKIAINSHDEAIDYTPLIIICGVAVAIGFIGLFWMLAKKEKKADYLIHTYEWKQDESAYRKLK